MTNVSAARSENLGDKVSACLLTYNHAHMLDEVFASLESQTLDGFELVISDDCSTDGTWELVRQWADKRDWARAIQTPENRAMAGNANYAVSQTDRPYVALLHHDDLYREDLLEKWAKALEDNPGASFVFNAYGYADDRSPDVHYERRLLDGRHFLEDRLLQSWGCPVRGTALIRKSCWNRVGGLREKFGSISDVDLWMRLAYEYDVAYVPEPLITIRQDRPEDAYPDEYVDFSWDRRRRLYEIHADNLRRVLADRSAIERRVRWWRFRLRVTLDRLRWYGYAVFKNEPELISRADRGGNSYEFAFAELFRTSLLKAGRTV
jgi:glycosyltransferase involved in cell wall biosynthesis